MNDFDYDVMQKKIVARSARNRKCGSKTKYVSLPSDNMTQAEWKRRNGEVMTYNLNQPMGWKDFLGMPQDLQKQYIEKLIGDYGVNSNALSEMFQVSSAHIRKTLQDLGIKRGKGGAAAMNAEKWSRWRTFLHPGADLPAETSEDATVTSQDIMSAGTAYPVGAEPTAVLCSGRLRYRGAAGEVLRQIYALLGEAPLEIEVSWGPVEEGGHGEN